MNEMVIIEKEIVESLKELKNFHRDFHFKYRDFVFSKGLADEFYDEYYPESNEKLEWWINHLETLNNKFKDKRND